MKKRRQSSDVDRANYVRYMFSRIARHYNLANQLMSFGRDKRWRKEAIQHLQLKPGYQLLDIGAGTGDLSREALRREPDIRLVSGELNFDMMQAGHRFGPLPWVNANTLCLPFPSESFDGVVSGFMLRNVTDVDAALNEQFRILKQGGRIVILETTPLRKGLLTPLIWVYMNLIIPVIGGIISGDWAGYRYLTSSSLSFLPAEVLARRMDSVGFKQVGFCRIMLGTVAIHCGKKCLKPAGPLRRKN